MSLGTLTIDLAANLAGLESDLGRAQRMFEANARGFQRTVASTAKVAAGVAAAGAVGMAALTKASIDNADAMYKQSQITGIQIGQLSKLAHAGEGADVEFADLTGGLTKFNKGIAAAAEGTGAQADAFKILGINIKNADGSLKTTDELFGEVAEAFSQFEDGANKSALATDLFSKSGAALIPLLNGGKAGLKDAGDELERMGGVLDEKTGKAAEKFNDNLHALNQSLAHMGTIIAKDVVEDLADFTDVLADPKTQEGITNLTKGLIGFTAWAVKSAAGLGDLGKSIGEYFARMQGYTDGGNIDHLRERLAELNDALGFADGAFLTDGLKNKFTAERKIIESQIEFYEESVKKLQPPKSDAGELPIMSPEASKSMQKVVDGYYAAKIAAEELAAAQKKAREDAASFKAGLDAELAAMRERATLGLSATELQKIQYRTLHGDLQKATAQTVALFEVEAKRIDLAAEELKAKDLLKKADEERKAMLLSLMSDEQRINYTYDEMIKKIKELGYSVEKTAELIKVANEKRDKELEKSTNKLSDITKNMYRDMQSGIGDAIYDGLNGRSSDIVDLFGNILEQMLAKALAADLMGAVFPGIGDGSGGGVVDLIAGIGGLFGGGKAVGGPVDSSKYYEVGEYNRPELFTSGSRQYLIPGNSGSVGPVGGGASNVIHINLGGIKDSREARQAAGAVSRAVTAGITRAQRYN